VQLRIGQNGLDDIRRLWRSPLIVVAVCAWIIVGLDGH